jgi:hypothetical protein
MSRPTLRFGSTGPVVTELQNALNAGESFLPTLKTDGIFGPKTHSRVKEFQASKYKAQDGVVGPLTWEALLPLLEKALNAGLDLFAAAGEAEARKKITDWATLEHSLYGWKLGDKPGPLNPHIATQLCAEQLTRLRQGGVHLTQIFATAGVASAACLTISQKAEKMYQGKYSAQMQNSTDIPNWCGIFAVYCYRMATLNVSWPLKINVVMKDKSQAQFRTLVIPKETPKAGDIGVVDSPGANHHFIVLEPGGQAFETIEANAALGSIARGHRTLAKFNPKNDYYLTPYWDRILTK